MKPLELTQFLSFRYLANLVHSPTKTAFAFTVAKANEEKNVYEQTLYVGDGAGVKKHKFLKENQDIIFYDDSSLLVQWQATAKEKKTLDQEMKSKLYRYHILSKKLESFATLPFKATVEAVLAPDKLLLKTSLTPENHILYQGDETQRKAHLKALKRASLYEVIETMPYYFNGRDFITNQCLKLFIYDVSDQSVEAVVSPDFNIESFTLSQDKTMIYLTGKPLERVRTFVAPLYCYDIVNKTLTCLSEDALNINQIIDLNDKIIVAARDMKTYGLNQNPDFYVLEGEHLNLFVPFGQAMHNTVGSDVRFGSSKSTWIDQETFYFVSTRDDHNVIHSLSASGELKTMFTMPGSIEGFIPFEDHFLIIGLKNQKLQELYALTQQGRLTQKTRLNTQVLKDKYIAKPQTMTVRFEHHEVKGFVLLPQDYDGAGKHPAILNIHGGPKTVYGQVYYHEMQYWASKGYVVFFANPRGSDGKGNEFADIRGKYGTIDYDDLMAFTDAVLETYSGIDQHHLFVTGGSYGGFMTNWIIGQTNRFKAAATQRCISNWESFYGTSDIGYYFATDQTAADPLTNRQKLYDQSPIKYVNNIETPLLLIHSDKDHRCPMEQAQQFHALLKVRGLETKLVWFKGENHELSRSGKPQARVKRLTEITQWFERFKT